MKFSIVVATYNRAEKLQKCVRSIMAQSYRDFELIVVDDGSTDDTEKVMKPFLADRRVRFITLGKNHGSATAARNRGIEEMTGNSLIIWDSDDELYPHALAMLAEIHQRFPEIVYVCANTDWIQSGKTIEEENSGEIRRLSYIDWFGGKRPRHAEVISVLRSAVGDVRFKSRGVDFMFYAEILGNTHSDIYYIHESCGRIFLESDMLSLTSARRRLNGPLSLERGPILADFLDTYGRLYIEYSPALYGSYAYGASVGLLLARKSKRAREFAYDAARYQPRARYWGFYMFSLIPFSSALLRVLFAIKGRLQKVR